MRDYEQRVAEAEKQATRGKSEKKTQKAQRIRERFEEAKAQISALKEQLAQTIQEKKAEKEKARKIEQFLRDYEARTEKFYQQEADIVRNIFKAYIQGASLKEIAEDLTAKKIPYTERTCVWDKARISRILENAKYTGDEEFEMIIDEDIYEEAAAVKSARRWNQAAQESEGIRQIRDRVRCGQCGAPMLRHINSKRAIRESWTCSNADCGIRVRISDGELLRKITLLMNRVIANADLMLLHPKIKHRDSAVVLNLQQQISDEMEQERPSEDRIATLLCEIAGQLYKETNAKTQIAAQIARKRVSLMKLQDAFNAAYFSELIDAVSLHVGGGVVLHTKTETDICESEDKPNGSPENSETDSFRN